MRPEATSVCGLFLTQVFGVEWAAAYLIPPVLDLCAHSNYLYRMTGPKRKRLTLKKKLIPPVLELCLYSHSHFFIT